LISDKYRDEEERREVSRLMESHGLDELKASLESIQDLQRWFTLEELPRACGANSARTFKEEYFAKYSPLGFSQFIAADDCTLESFMKAWSMGNSETSSREVFPRPLSLPAQQGALRIVRRVLSYLEWCYLGHLLSPG
jgi:hypothetical protein